MKLRYALYYGSEEYGFKCAYYTDIGRPARFGTCVVIDRETNTIFYESNESKDIKERLKNGGEFIENNHYWDGKWMKTDSFRLAVLLAL